MLVCSARTVLARPLAPPGWIAAPVAAPNGSQVHVTDWKMGRAPWLWNYTLGTRLRAAARTHVAGLHEGLLFQAGVLPRLLRYEREHPDVLAELYAADFAAEEFAPWTLLDLLGGTYTSVLEPREYPGLEVDPLVPTCGAAIRVLGYVYEYLFDLQQHRLQQRILQLM